MITWILVIVLLAVSIVLTQGSGLDVKAAVTSVTISVSVSLAFVKLVTALGLVELNAIYFGKSYVAEFPTALIFMLVLFHAGLLATYQRLTIRENILRMDAIAKAASWFIVITSGIFLYYLGVFLFSTIAFTLCLLTHLLVFVSKDTAWRAGLVASILVWVIPMVVAQIAVEHFLVQDVFVWHSLEQSSGIKLLGFPLEDIYLAFAFPALSVLIYNGAKSRRQPLNSI